MVITGLTFTSHALHLNLEETLQWEVVLIMVLSKFPHYWVFSPLN